MSQHSSPLRDQDLDNFVHPSPASECLSLVSQHKKLLPLKLLTPIPQPDEDETWVMPTNTPTRGPTSSSEGPTWPWDESTSSGDDDWCEEGSWQQAGGSDSGTDGRRPAAVGEGNRGGGGGEVEVLQQKVTELLAQLDLSRQEKERDAGAVQQMLLYFQRERDVQQHELERAVDWQDLALQLQGRLDEKEIQLGAVNAELEAAWGEIAVLEEAGEQREGDLEAACEAAEAGWEEVNVAREEVQTARLDANHARDIAIRASAAASGLNTQLQVVQASLLQVREELEKRDKELEDIRSW